MLVLIDGYNLLFRLLSPGENLAQERDKLIFFLSQKLKPFSFKSVVVFDSQYHPSEAQKKIVGSLEIIYTHEHETADDHILNMIKKEATPKNCLVVTSDERLAWRARRFFAKTESIQNFLTKINKAKRKEKRIKNFKALPNIVKEKTEAPKTEDEILFEHYLLTFEERYQKLPELPSKNLKVSTEKKKNRKKEIDAPKESDYERWLREFEKRLGA